eukprot:TRINITY_DN10082_c0_g1_i1.p1 TRINITY_DN10082_c0_g1~~TRINITY_DN10082_c0_g1_i1.p1  ORF type:complete len:301 (+),score=39.36 TRINITY_DN10082_c0_g1_i1:46-948(+)
MVSFASCSRVVLLPVRIAENDVWSGKGISFLYLGAVRSLQLSHPSPNVLKSFLSPPSLSNLRLYTNSSEPHTIRLGSARLGFMDTSQSSSSFFLDNFVLRQWNDPNYPGPRITSVSTQGFLSEVERLYASGNYPLIDGYAPFCKHIFMPNFVGAKVEYIEITDANNRLLRSGYRSRTPQELPVLMRWFPASLVTPPEAEWLDIILYSREQLIIENEAMAKKLQPEAEKVEVQLPDAPWGIICVKAQEHTAEILMQPITMMRNALGKEEGGSGVPLNGEKYRESVEFWQRHASVSAHEAGS